MSDQMKIKTDRMVKQLNGAGMADVADHMEQLYAYRILAIRLEERVTELEEAPVVCNLPFGGSIRFDVWGRLQEKAVRAKLISLGWKPPGDEI